MQAVLATLVLVVAGVFTESLQAQGRAKQGRIPYLNSEASTSLAIGQNELRQGQLEVGIKRVQLVLEKNYGENLLVAVNPSGEIIDRTAEDKSKRSFRPRFVQRRAISSSLMGQKIFQEALHAFPKQKDWAYRLLEHYESEYGSTAQAYYDRAKSTHDLDVLLKCFECYPLCKIWFEAGLLAASLHMERQEFFEAERVLLKISRNPLFARLSPHPAIESLINSRKQGISEQEKVFLVTPSQNKQRLLRLEQSWSLLQELIVLSKPQLSEDLDSTNKEGDRAAAQHLAEGEGGSDEPASLVDSQLPNGSKFIESRAKKSALPSLPFSKGKAHWVTLAYDQPKHGTYSRPLHYVRQAAIQGPYLCLSLLNEIQYYELATGRLSLPRIKQPKILNSTKQSKRKLARPEYFHLYKEIDPNLRSKPVLTKDYLVSNYVISAIESEQYYGYQIIESIPRRGIRVYDKRAKLVWDSNEQGQRVLAAGAEGVGLAPGAELLPKVSFNSTPLVIANRLYALGWYSAGNISSFLAAFDLHSGDFLWGTRVGENQIDLTMFGALNSEPMPGGLIYEKGQLYASSQLGSFCRVDCKQGRIQWYADYEALPIQEPKQTQAKIHRDQFWQPSKIIDAGNTIILSPTDARAAMVFSKKNGLQIWSQSSLGTKRFMMGMRSNDSEDISPELSPELRVVVVARDQIYILPDNLSKENCLRQRLLGSVRARPALTKEGLVYTTDNSLCFFSFKTLKNKVICRLSKPTGFNSRRFSSGCMDGAVTVLDDQILVTNSYFTASYKKL